MQNNIKISQSLLYLPFAYFASWRLGVILREKKRAAGSGGQAFRPDAKLTKYQ